MQAMYENMIAQVKQNLESELHYMKAQLEAERVQNCVLEDEVAVCQLRLGLWIN
jgi:hypothetical protein